MAAAATQHQAVLIQTQTISVQSCTQPANTYKGPAASSPAVTQYKVAATPKLAYMAPDMANMGLLIVVSRVPKMTILAGDRMSASVPLTLLDRLHSSCAMAWRLPICALAAVKELPVRRHHQAGQAAC